MWLKVVVCLVVAAGLLDTSVWWFVTGAIIDDLPPFVAAAATQGYQLHLGNPHRGGWPLIAAVRVDAATLAVGALDVAAENVEVEIRPWEPGTLQIVSRDPLRMQLGGQSLGISGGPIIVKAPLSAAPATLEASDLLVKGAAEFSLQRLTGSIAPLAVTFIADNLQPGQAMPPPFDTGLLVSARVVTNHPFPPADTPQAAVRAWQLAGGALSVSSVDVRWGPLHVAGSAKGAVDRNLQPEGQARLEVQGADPAIDFLTRTHVLQPGPASAIHAVVQLLGLAAHGGPIPVTMTFSEGVLTVAGFPLMRLGPINWDLPVER